jgi:hypothetical protein
MVGFSHPFLTIGETFFEVLAETKVEKGVEKFPLLFFDKPCQRVQRLFRPIGYATNISQYACFPPRTAGLKSGRRGAQGGSQDLQRDDRR